MLLFLQRLMTGMLVLLGGPIICACDSSLFKTALHAWMGRAQPPELAIVSLSLINTYLGWGQHCGTAG